MSVQRHNAPVCLQLRTQWSQISNLKMRNTNDPSTDDCASFPINCTRPVIRQDAILSEIDITVLPAASCRVLKHELCCAGKGGDILECGTDEEIPANVFRNPRQSFLYAIAQWVLSNKSVLL